MSVDQIRHSGIVVASMDAALEFYRDLFGFAVYWDQVESWEGLAVALGLPEVEVRTVKMSPNPAESKLAGIELLEFRKPRSPAPVSERTLQTTGCTHLALQVRDLAALRTRLRARGMDFIAEPQLSPDGKVRLAFCRAPEQVFLELVEVLQ